MSITTTDAKGTGRSKLRRFLVWSTLGFVALIAILVCTSIYVSGLGKENLTRIIADLDRTDPHWRLEDMDQDLPILPDDQNSALLAKRILQEKPTAWMKDNADQVFSSGSTPPQCHLSPEKTAVLKKEIEQAPDMVASIGKLALLPHGYLKIPWAKDPIGTLLPVVQESREIANLAHLLCWFQIEQKDYDGAMESCQAILNIGRSDQGDYTMISMLVHIAIRTVGLNDLQRVLAQGEPADSALFAMQNLLEDEMRQPLFTQSLRGERAFGNRLFEYLYSGGRPGIGLSGLLNMPLLSRIRLGSVSLDSVLGPLFVGSIYANRAAHLELMTQCIEASKKSDGEQRLFFADIDKRSKDSRLPRLARLMLPAVSKTYEANRRSEAMVRSAMMAMAAERYRQKHGRWPDSLGALVPEFAQAVASDPYDGEPLRFKRLADGLVIYSIGQDMKDDGGQVINVNGGMVLDTGFRLWDVKARRQPPALPEKDKEQEPDTADGKRTS